jgi:cytochrome c peroxidase
MMNNTMRRASIPVFFLFLLACSSLPTKSFRPFQPLPPQPPIPADNPQTADKVRLGKQLFFDPRLAADGVTTCNSCHNLALGGDNDQAVSTGAGGGVGRRNPPTLWNVAFNTIYSWDGRATSLEALLAEHLLDPTAMGMPSEHSVTQRLTGIPGYRQQFAAVFSDTDAGVSYADITRALSAFLRTLVTVNSPFDRYLAGDKDAVTEQVLDGFNEYIEVGCASCHFWVNFAGPVPGLAFQMGEGFYELFPNHPGSEYEKRYALAEDIGRYQVTGIETDKRMWRVSTLRNIAVTAPYFHNGSVNSLEEAVRIMASVQLKVQLTERQVADMVTFLNSLTGEFPPIELPVLPATAGKTALQPEL